EKQREIKLGALLASAAVIFNQKGYEGLSLAQVAAEIGISKQALYHYARSKEDLMYKCYFRTLQQAEQGYDSADAVGGSGLDKVVHFVRFQLNAKAPPFASLDHMGALSAEHRKEISAWAKRLERRMRGF